MTINHSAEDVDSAYADAPALDDELTWLRARTGAPGFETSREFLLRQAALLDRLARRAAVVPLVRAALAAADHLVAHDIEHHGLSPKGHDLAAAEDHQAYAREAYRDWRHAQNR
ncbi:hypothetical protein ACFQ7A_00080 [Streptomyces sp. NPDC056528]|uniref:hypothetical protein n=1 Tax=Streptomyces sp. NPDC056528 TaxID=3345854 RepID=UPI0036C8183F